jgi:hypothetical protein
VAHVTQAAVPSHTDTLAGMQFKQSDQGMQFPDSLAHLLHGVAASG